MPDQSNSTAVTSDRVARVRAALPAVQAGAYFNTGTCGPVPLAAATALHRQWEADVQAGRIGPGRFETLFATIDAARRAVADLLATDPANIALTTSTSHGMNVVLWGLPWSPGDEILTTLDEHPGLQVPLATVSQRFGVRVRPVGVDASDPDAVVAAFERAASARTRLLAVSHVLWTNGAVLPIQRLAALARRLGARLLVDGAQSVGALAVHPHDLGVDFYALPGQKWLCGPEGTGALYVAPEALPAVQVAFGAYLSAQAVDAAAPAFVPRPGAARFEALMPMGGVVAGLEAALTWLRGVDFAWVWERTDGLARRLHRALSSSGVEVLTPLPAAGAPASGLISFRIPGRDPVDTASTLVERGFIVRSVPGRQPVVRASTGFFNTEDEIDALAAAAGELVR